MLGLAFAAGVLTIVSPCALPVLPIILGSGLGPHHRLRVATTIAGFGGTFLLATVVLAAAFANAGLTLASLRVLAAVVIGLAGLSIAVPAVERAVERSLSPIANWAGLRLPGPRLPGPRLPGELAAGLRPSGAPHAAMTGVATGVLLGLVWAPCVGPLMAGVIATAVLQGPTLGGFAVALAYVAGTASALAILALAAARIQGPGLRRTAARARSVSGVAMVLAAVLVLSGLDTQLGVGLTLQPDALVQSASNGGADNVTAPRDLGPAPDLTGITAWINTEPTSLAAHRGEVVLVHFWTFGCINCQNVQPYVKDWYARYRDQGFTVLSIHTPELSFERDVDNVRNAVAAKGVEYPVAFDPDFATWKAYGNQYWPAFYFVDKRGHIRHVHFGEGDYAGSEAVIQALLAEPA